MTVVKTSLRNFFAHKGRMALSAVAVLLSVAFVCGTLVFTDTINATFDKLFNTTAADVAVKPKEVEHAQETGRAETLPASLITRIRAVDGVKSARGDAYSEKITVVDADNKKVGPTGGAPTIGTDWDPSEHKAVDLTSGKAPSGPSEAMIDKDTADKKHVKIGDELRVIAVPGDFTVKVTGIVTFRTTNPGAAIFYFDTPTAQTKLLGKPDAFSSINLDAKSGVSNGQLKKSVVAALGTDYEVQTKAEIVKDNQKDLGSFLGFMKKAMLGFAAVSVLVGIFLIVNTFSMLVAQRTREIGLMRAVGASRRQVNRSVLVEALLLGVVGSLLGIGAGVGLAIGLMKLMGSVGMHLDTSELTIKTATPVTGLALGVIVTVLAAYLPARRAGKVSPMAALRDSGMPADGKSGKVRAWIGVALSLIGGACLYAAASADTGSTGAQFLGLGVLLTLIGFVVVGPLLAGLVVKAISAVVLRVFGPVGRLAERNALRNPRRTGATAAALMIGLALVAALSVVGSSMVASANDQLDKSVGADFIIQADNQQQITPKAEEAIKGVPGLDHVTDYKVVNARLTLPDGKSDDSQMTAADASYTKDLRVETVHGKLEDAYATDSMSVNEGYAKDHKIKLGDEVTAAFVGGRTAKLKIAAITTDDTSFDKGALYTSIGTAQKYLPADKLPLDVIMFAEAKDGQEKQSYAALKDALSKYPTFQVRNQADFKEQIQSQVSQLLNLVYGLLGLAIIVAVLGVVNTLALSVVERTREIGLMRAIGLSRRQLRRMIRLESVVIALFGALVGLGLGMGWGATAQKLLALEGLGVLEIPWATIIWVFFGSAVVGLIAALVPAFRAGRMNVLNAIATE
ncbi:ABC transporter permease [Wenjunlia tyrosinilytica]|uniref:Membrane protein n=1 Tax=Wenjunlia tyrosinilytica TaxID=1544741 RepID=A0A917ZPV6_9ACTN|nr:ABC transporter permease [Wenjunlia tyrosinilytica]GGO88314.1 membrane protein [Wenjunlia tyrosinilytica]